MVYLIWNMRKFFLTIFLAFFLSAVFVPSVVFAQAGTGDTGDTAGSGTGSRSGEITQIENPLGEGAGDPRFLIGRIIGAVLGIIGSVALAIFVYGGLTWMTSAGNPDKVRKGKEIVIWAVLGLAVIFTSYAIINFVITSFTGEETEETTEEGG